MAAERRCKASAKRFERSRTALAEWTELKETLTKFLAARGKETSDDKGSNDVTSKAAESNWKSFANLLDLCSRKLARGNMWDSLAT